MDPVTSPEDWTFTFGESANLGTNIYFALNRIYLFKGNADIYFLGPSDPFSSETQDVSCQTELIDTE